MIDRLAQYLASGGAVMPPLVASGLVLWYLVVLRASLLRRGIRGNLDARLVQLAGGEAPPDHSKGLVAAGLELLHRSARSAAERGDARLLLELAPLTLSRYRKPIRALVTTAPLLGLLGTVSGMIETFASLGDMALFSRSGGVAGGIAEALVSTQMGLLVAIPGLLAARLLEAKQRRLDHELGRLREIASTGKLAPGAGGVA